MNPAAPAFATGTRVAGVVLIAAYVSGLVPGAVVSLVGGLALITFGRALWLDRAGTAVSGAALAVVAGALGVAALRWGTLSLHELVGAQSVLGPTVAVGPRSAAISSQVALAATTVALAAWVTEPAAHERAARMWGRVEAIVAVFAATLVFAAPGVGGGPSELVSAPEELAVTAATNGAGVVVVLIAPRLLRSRRVRWIAISTAAVAVAGAAAVLAGSL